MTWFEVIVISIVEGLTEFLPVSSTGHMIIAEHLLGIEMTDFVKAFTVIIQLGAILSVVVLYWKRFFQSFDFYWKLCVGVLPAVVMGLFFSSFIKSIMGEVWVIGLTLLLGGLVMLFVDKWFERNVEEEEISYKKSLMIGIFQCIAMIPGVSRSMASIVGGMSQGLSRRQAAEFSFFLAVPTMFGATAKELYELLKDPNQLLVLKEYIPELLVGNLVAFLVALLAIKGFIGYISKKGFRNFGYYRIIVGGLILILIACGISLNIV